MHGHFKTGAFIIEPSMRFELNDAYMRKAMREMDSIKNEFYRQRKYNQPKK